jgi:hypothetical protein
MRSEMQVLDDARDAYDTSDVFDLGPVGQSLCHCALILPPRIHCFPNLQC